MPPVSNQVAASVLDIIAEPIVFLDRALRCVFANETALGLLRKTPGELLGRHVWDVFPQPPDSALRGAVECAIETGQVAHGVGPISEDTWFDCHSYPSEEGIAIVFRDVTEGRRAEAASIQTERRFRAMADAVSVLIWMAAPDRSRTYFNMGWVAFTGRAAEEEKGTGWIEGIHPDDVDQCLRVYASAFDRQEPYLMEYRLRRRDGVYRWLLDQGVPIFDEDGTFSGFIGTCVDINERRHAEEQLTFLAHAGRLLGSSLDYQETLRHVADLMVPRLADWCAVDVFDTDGHLVRVAVSHVLPERARSVLEQGERYPSDPDNPHPFAHVVRTGQSVLVPDVTDEILQGNVQNADHLEALRRLGFRSLMAVPLKVREKSVGAIMMAWAETTNIYTESDLKFAEEVASRGAIAIENARLFGETRTSASRLKAFNETLESRVQERTTALAQAVRELEVRNHELEDFAYVASHDLQEPLRKISTFAGLVEDEYGEAVDEEGRMYLSRITDASRRMGNLINDLLAYSRVSSRLAPFEKIDLNAVVSSVLTDLEVALRESHGLVEVGALPTIEADRTQMRQLFQNLIGNALKFRDANRTPVVRVTARQVLPQNGSRETAPRFTFEVRDNGIGFDPQHADRIFLPFKRLHTQGEYPGTGVGLAICRRIVERHGGSVTAESTPGGGSTFRVTLPATHSDDH